jgi:hypothetical protein
MSATLISTLDRLLDPVGRCLTPEVARAFVDLRADPEFQNRLDELADKSTSGQLTAQEQAEYDLYLAAISVVTVLQSMSRTLLKTAGN